MEDGWPRSRRYAFGSLGNWALFLFGVFWLSRASGREGWPDWALWLIALALAGTVAGQFAAAYRLIARQDEYIRGVTAKRAVAAAGVTLTAAVLAGLIDQFVGGPHLPMWLVYPGFWAAFGVVTPLVRRTLP